MIHYHGLPITPEAACAEAISGGHAFVSVAHPGQLGVAVEIAQSFALDNGAFSVWRSGKKADWSMYYDMVAYTHRLPGFDFAVIPDVIEGGEPENDAMLAEWPWKEKPWIGAPVWHMHESLDRLASLRDAYPRVCIGSSGEFMSIGNQRWWGRIAEAMNVLCDRDGRPICRIHGLRMLDVEVFTRIPFASADSTNIGRNVGIDSRWTGAYTPQSKPGRARVLRERIEAFQSPERWARESAFQQNVLPMFCVS
jgi:hypothetical protein